MTSAHLVFRRNMTAQASVPSRPNLHQIINFLIINVFVGLVVLHSSVVDQGQFLLQSRASLCSMHLLESVELDSLVKLLCGQVSSCFSLVLSIVVPTQREFVVQIIRLRSRMARHHLVPFTLQLKSFAVVAHECIELLLIVNIYLLVSTLHLDVSNRNFDEDALTRLFCGKLLLVVCLLELQELLKLELLLVEAEAVSLVVLGQ